MIFEPTTDLMPHQVLATAKVLPSRVGALFMDPGTGKSRTLLQLARQRRGKFRKLFWFTPCSLRDNVRQQILTHTDIDPSRIAIWDDRTLTQGIPPSAQVHIVGIETMSTSDRAVLAYNAELSPDDFVACDESDLIKGWRAVRSQRLRHMSARSKYRLAMSGTAFTQGPVDLYSQMMFLSDKILGYRSFWSFAANHLEFEERTDAFGRRRRTGRIVRTLNEGYIASRIEPYVYQVRKDDCLDLPGQLYEERYLSMTPEQRELYERAKDEVLSIDYEDWSPVRIFHLYTSLQTILCGFWMAPDGRHYTVPHNRTDVLLDTIASLPAGEKVIIWVKYIHAMEDVAAALGERYGPETVACYHGGISDAQRGAALDRWRSSARFLVGTQASGGRGLTLNEAAYTIFYADSFKYSERRQAEDRNHRIGQDRRVVYLSLRCVDSIDMRIGRALQIKGNSLAAFQAEIANCQQLRLRDRAVALVRSL
ncbi:helicase-related protein [Pannonibacter tanglangensis]